MGIAHKTLFSVYLLPHLFIKLLREYLTCRRIHFRMCNITPVLGTIEANHYSLLCSEGLGFKHLRKIEESGISEKVNPS